MSDFLLALFAGLAFAPLAFWWCCCGGCTCTLACASDAAPCEFQVEISGAATVTCAACTTSAVNATFILPKVVGEDCEWEYFLPATICPGIGQAAWGSLRLNLFQSGGHYRARVEFTGGGLQIVANHDFGTSKPDCTAISALSMTPCTSACFTNHCDWSGATILLTAI